MRYEQLSANQHWPYHMTKCERGHIMCIGCSAAVKGAKQIDLSILGFVSRQPA